MVNVGEGGVLLQNRKKLLIVDDHSENRKALCSFLKDTCYLLEAQGSEEALAAAAGDGAGLLRSAKRSVERAKVHAVCIDDHGETHLPRKWGHSPAWATPRI